MLLSLTYRLLRFLFSQLSGRLRWDHAGRLWLAALSRLMSRRWWAEVFPVTPATILRWHRNLVARKWDYTTRRSGRATWLWIWETASAR